MQTAQRVVASARQLIRRGERRAKAGVSGVPMAFQEVWITETFLSYSRAGK